MSAETKRKLFDLNINKAFDWLFEVQDKDNFGWSWIRDISPNSQNTAEVVSVCVQLSEYLDKNQKALVCEAVENWLLEPSINGAIVIDYVWMMYSLVQFVDKYEEFAPEFSKEKVYLAAAECADIIIQLRNDDGAWSDTYGYHSTSVWTALVVYCMKSYTLRMGSTPQFDEAVQIAADWLVQIQNADGGWGNMSAQKVMEAFREKEKEFSRKTISEQYLSQPVSTGYVLMALGHIAPYKYHESIQKGIDYLKSVQKPDGSYDIFYEVGIRKDVTFTFRHFGTVWALKGLLRNTQVSFSDPCISKALYYLINLQDDATGGWKCALESDVYTWSTANALSILAKILYTSDNAFSFELRDYIDDILEQSIYMQAEAEKEPAVRSDEVQNTNNRKSQKRKRRWLGVILKMFVLLPAILWDSVTGFIVGLLVLIDIILISKEEEQIDEGENLWN